MTCAASGTQAWGAVRSRKMVRADDDGDETCYGGCPWCLVAADDDATQMMIAGLTTLSPPFADEWNICNTSSTPRWHHGQMSPFRDVLAHLARRYHCPRGVVAYVTTLSSLLRSRYARLGVRIEMG